MADHLEAVLFDLDGTLVDSERESAEAMARALAAAGLVIEQSDRDFIIGRSWVDIDRELRERYARYTLDRDELIRRTSAERAAIVAAHGLPIMPGAREAISRFGAALPLAIVTGSSRVEAAEALDVLGLADRFAVVLAAEDVGSSKPDPEGYLAAAAAVRARPERCLVIEDSTAGIVAGRTAGAWVVAVRAGNFSNQDQSGAHLTVDTLAEITDELLLELCGMVPPGASTKER